MNGAYDFKGMEKDTSPLMPYITKDSTGFYKCFIAHFGKIEAEHAEIFGKQ